MSSLLNQGNTTSKRVFFFQCKETTNVKKSKCYEKVERENQANKLRKWNYKLNVTFSSLIVADMPSQERNILVAWNFGTCGEKELFNLRALLGLCDSGFDRQHFSAMVIVSYISKLNHYGSCYDFNQYKAENYPFTNKVSFWWIGNSLFMKVY